MPGFGILHLRRLTDRPARIILAVGGIAAGVALVVAILGVYGSIITSVDRLNRVAGSADLEVSGAGGAGVAVDRVTAAVDGEDVATAPLVRTPIAVNGEVVLLIGADSRAAPFGGDLAQELAPHVVGAGEGLVLTASLAERLDLGSGDTVDVFSNTGGGRSHPIGAVVDAPALDSVNRGDFVFAPFPTAQELLGRDGVVDSVLIDVADGADLRAVRDRVREALGPGVLVEERDVRADRIAAPAITYLSQVGPVAGMALVVGGFLVFNTMNMAAMERRREIATLRMLGATRRRIVAGLLGEAGVLGLVGSLIGLGLGMALARAVVAALPPAMEVAIGVKVSFALPTAMLVGAVALGVGAAIAATLVPALRATKEHPLQALRPTGTLAAGGEPVGISWRTFQGGVLMMVLGTIIVIAVRGDRAAGGILLLTVGGVVASYGAAEPIARAAARVARLGGGLGHLAASGLQRSPHRVWATTMAVALAVSMTLAVASGARNQLDVDEAHLANLRDSDLIVAPRSLDRLATDLYLPADQPDALAAVDGVEATSAMVIVPAVRDGKGILVYGARAEPGPSSFPLLDRADADVQAATLRGESVIISRQFARAFDVDEGDRLQIDGSTDTVVLPVGQVVNTLSPSDNGMIVLGADHVRSVYDTSGWSSIDVAVADGADVAAVQRQIEQLGSDRPYPMVVSTGAEAYDDVMDDIRAAIGMMYPILAVTVAVAGLAVLNTLVASILDRWRELGVLRAVGTTPRQLAQIISLEAVGVGVVGTTVGLVVGEWVHWAGIRYVGNASPLPVEFSIEPQLIVVAAIAGVAATVIGSLVPIRRATRVDVLAAIAWE